MAFNLINELITFTYWKTSMKVPLSGFWRGHFSCKSECKSKKLPVMGRRQGYHFNYIYYKILLPIRDERKMAEFLAQIWKAFMPGTGIRIWWRHLHNPCPLLGLNHLFYTSVCLHPAPLSTVLTCATGCSSGFSTSGMIHIFLQTLLTWRV